MSLRWIGRGRRDAEAAVADHHGGHAMPRRDAQHAVPQDLRVVVRVDVDEARRDDLALGVDGRRGRPVGLAQRDDLAVLDADVADEARLARAVDDRAARDLQIEGHDVCSHECPFILSIRPPPGNAALADALICCRQRAGPASPLRHVGALSAPRSETRLCEPRPGRRAPLRRIGPQDVVSFTVPPGKSRQERKPMAKHKIALIPGDGIGKEVVPEGMRVLEAAGRRFGFELEFDRLRLELRPLRQDRQDDAGGRAGDSCKAFESIFLGAVGWPGVPDHVSLWGLLIPIRREFDAVRQPAAGAAVRGRAVPARRPQAGRDRFLGRAREHRGRVQLGRRPHVPGHRRRDGDPAGDLHPQAASTAS